MQSETSFKKLITENKPLMINAQSIRLFKIATKISVSPKLKMWNRKFQISFNDHLEFNV